MPLHGYDAWKTRCPEDELDWIDIECEQCGEKFILYEEVIQVSDGVIHEDCLDDWVRDYVILYRGRINRRGELE